MPKQYYRFQDLGHHEPRRRQKSGTRRDSQHTPPVKITLQSFPLESISPKNVTPQRICSKGGTARLNPTSTVALPIYEPRFHALPILVPLLGPLPICALSNAATSSMDSYAGLWQRLWRSVNRLSLGDGLEYLTDGVERSGLKRKKRRA
ncbi:hypothetical protein MMC14_007523 [Varicellaria rhodocarpa]|nr:hypothetical protein [Varicellaria rhodocarpa]